MRKICATYWLLLTFLLLSRDPLAWFLGNPSVGTLYSWLEPAAHFMAFSVLALVVLASGWPRSRAWAFALLIGYGILTELAQSQIPHRRMELQDFVQDFAGVLAGAGIYWTWRMWRGPKPDIVQAGDDVWQQPRRRTEPLARKTAGDTLPS